MGITEKIDVKDGEIMDMQAPLDGEKAYYEGHCGRDGRVVWKMPPRVSYRKRRVGHSCNLLIEAYEREHSTIRVRNSPNPIEAIKFSDWNRNAKNSAQSIDRGLGQRNAVFY